MQITFNNRFEIAQGKGGAVRVHYRHNLRCPLKMYIEKSGPKPGKNGAARDRDWDIVMEGGSQVLADEFGARLAADVTRYLKQRTRKSAASLSFRDIEKLATIRSIG